MLRPRYGRWAIAFTLALILRTFLFTTPNNVQGGGFMMTTHLLFAFIIKLAIDGILDHKPDPLANYRPLPAWGWITAALFYPSGLFLAYGHAGLLRWRKALFFTAFSYAALVLFVSFIATMERTEDGHLFQSILMLVFAGSLLAWGKFLHGIGTQVNYWSRDAQQVWRWAKWSGISLLGLSALSVMIALLTSSR
jgi:hypothetical protein